MDRIRIFLFAILAHCGTISFSQVIVIDSVNDKEITKADIEQIFSGTKIISVDNYQVVVDDSAGKILQLFEVRKSGSKKNITLKRNGSFYQFNSAQQVEVIGRYRKNLKEGIWFIQNLEGKPRVEYWHKGKLVSEKNFL